MTSFARAVEELVAARLAAADDALEDDLATAIELQDFDQLDRLQVVYDQSRCEVPPAVASSVTP